MNLKRLISFLLCLIIATGVAFSEIHEKVVNYSDGKTGMQGFLAYSGSPEGKPGILVIHEWWGHNEYARSRARKLAGEGYVAFAVDMYGEGRAANHPKDAARFSRAVMKNIKSAKSRFQSALKLLREKTGNDSIAALGYCFGGTVGLQMLRLGSPLKAVVTFHSGLGQPVGTSDIKGKPVLVFNGASDKMVTASQIKSFKEDMQSRGVDLHFVNLPGARHSFTNPEATEIGDKFDLPIEYSEQADKRSWERTLKFLAKTLGRVGV